MNESDGDWPVDPDGDEGSEGGRSYGLSIIADKVDEDEDFPLDVAAFVEEYGDYPVRINHATVVSVSDVFAFVDADTVEDKVAFNEAVGDALREGDFWDYAPSS